MHNSPLTKSKRPRVSVKFSIWSMLSLSMGCMPLLTTCTAVSKWYFLSFHTRRLPQLDIHRPQFPSWSHQAVHTMHPWLDHWRQARYPSMQHTLPGFSAPTVQCCNSEIGILAKARTRMMPAFVYHPCALYLWCWCCVRLRLCYAGYQDVQSLRRCWCTIVRRSLLLFHGWVFLRVFVQARWCLWRTSAMSMGIRVRKEVSATEQLCCE